MKTILLLIACALLTGCATGEKMGSIQPGMSAQQVVSILGRPDGFSTDDQGRERYHYTNRIVSGWGMDRGDYTVVFTNGRVSSYGASEIRANPVQRHIVIPVRGLGR